MRTALTTFLAATVLATTAVAPAAAAVDPIATTVALVNKYRAKHGAAPLTLDPAVTATAQDWADRLQTTDSFQHRPDNKYGENMYKTTAKSKPTSTVGTAAVDDWYNESRGYNYAKEYTSSNVDYTVLHFTALVWQSSTKVGVGLSQGKNGTFVVLNFAERGNTLGKFVTNVRPPIS
ncbi:CAP family protein [Umezawaea tangerina]|uniref:Cysteine-rich secretory protein family protein n=1 Tax=Umezawaea tangerina TaxID=84725 RepID=A0A2T0THG4_9PSEU|nr:CAP family protein [Umezawaea tangerina]PRY45051.1 Cysteine-rich secretory protein family protein [Umezawaea tangerina]